MGKKFFEVFPSLKLDTGLRDLYEQVTVEKVSATKRKDFLRVYISSDRLIQKEDVFRAEGEIKKQFFPNVPMVIKFYERFHLSSQYDPKKLTEIYRDSILLELREYSPVEYNLFKKADIAFAEENTLQLTVEDTVLGKSKAEELTRILEKIYNERCGFAVSVQISYKEHITGKYKKEDEHRLAMQVAEISARAGYGGGRPDGYMEGAEAGTDTGFGMAGLHNSEAGYSQGAASGVYQDDFAPYMQGAAGDLAPGQLMAEGQGAAGGFGGFASDQSGAGVSLQGQAGNGGVLQAQSGAVSMAGGQKPAGQLLPGAGQAGRYGAKSSFKGGRKGEDGKKSDFRRALKRSDNPDVLYGRDFDEESMPINDIIGEMGEVVIRGRILNMEIGRASCRERV